MAIPGKFLKSQSSCCICYTTFDHSPKKEANPALQIKLFEVYCQLLKIQNLKWNIKRDGFPFCLKCFQDVTALAELKGQLTKIQTCIDKIVESTKVNILISKSKSDKVGNARYLKRVDYVRNLAVRDFEPVVKVLKINLLQPNRHWKIEGDTVKIRNQATKRVQKVNNFPSKALVKQENVLPIKNGNAKVNVRDPKLRASVSTPRTTTSKTATCAIKSVAVQKAQINQWETIDLLSDDDEVKDPNFTASDIDIDVDVEEYGSERSWFDGSNASSLSPNSLPTRKSARMKRKSIKMLEADIDNSQIESVPGGSQPQPLKYPRLSTEKEKHKCGDCVCSFTAKKALLKHLRLNNHRPYDELAGKDSNEENKSIFDSVPGKIVDVQKAEVYPFECKICWTRYSTINKLRAHEKDHLGKQSFVCTNGNCRISFTESTLLADHIKKVHEKENEQSLLAFMNSSQEKPSDDLNLSFLDDLSLRVPSPTPEESFRIIEDDPMFKLDIDVPIIRPEDEEPMGFENIDYNDPTPVDYSDGHISFFDQVSQSQALYYYS